MNIVNTRPASCTSTNNDVHEHLNLEIFDLVSIHKRILTHKHKPKQIQNENKNVQHTGQNNETENK